MTIRSGGRHRKTRPAGRVWRGFRRWAGFVPVLAVLTAAIVAGGGSPAVAADNPNPTVEVGGDPRGVAVDSDGKHAYVASYADNALRVIDTTSRRVVGSIRVKANPQGVAVDPDSRHAFVTNYSEDSVSVIDTSNGKVITNVPVGANPTAAAVFPRDHYAFVTNYYSNTVSVINSANFKVVGVVAVGQRPDGIAVDPRGQFAYVTNSASNSVSVIDIHAQKVVRTVLVGRSPQKIAIDPDGRHAYVTNLTDNTVSVIDLPTQVGVNLDPLLKTVKNVLPGNGTSPVSSIIPVGLHPRGLAVSRDSKHAFVVNTGNETMSVIDTSTGSVIRTAYVGYSPDEVAVGPDGSAYVTSRADGTVTVIRP